MLFLKNGTKETVVSDSEFVTLCEQMYAERDKLTWNGSRAERVNTEGKGRMGRESKPNSGHRHVSPLPNSENECHNIGHSCA